MRFPDYRHKYPCVRLVLPLLAGICFFESFSGTSLVVQGVGAVTLFLSVLLVSLSVLSGSFSRRWLWGAGIFLFLFSTAIFLSLRSAGRIRWNEKIESAFYVGRVSGSPREKPKTIVLPVRVTACRDTLESRSCDRTVLLYLPKDSAARQVGWGDYLLFSSRISPPANAGNPREFDYASFLFHRGIGRISLAGRGEWQKIPGTATLDLRQKADACRTKILDMYRRLGFKGDELAVLSALTVGYKDDLSEDIRHAFSASGVSHVLALSGLHIGLVYLLLGVLFAWTGRISGFRAAKPVLIIGCLWVFAFVTGLSPSVVRSTAMFSLVAVSVYFSGRSVTLNTLAAAAFFMLLCNPFYLSDVSFQLSFLSVAGIVLIQPRLSQTWTPANRFLKYLWGMVTVTIAAQVVTAPLVLYYFSGFPIHFLWVNLLVVPLVTLILYLAAAMLMAAWFPPLQVFFAGILERLLAWLTGLTGFVGQLPVSVIGNLYLDKLLVLGLFLLLAFISAYLVHKNKRYLYAAVTLLLALALVHLQESADRRARPSIVFYNSRTCPCVHFISSGEDSYLWAARGDSVLDRLRPSVVRFWLYHRISDPVVLPENYAGGKIINSGGLIGFSGKKVCVVKDDRWHKKETGTPLVVDYLYICKGFRGQLADLTRLFTIGRVVLDSSLPVYRLEKLEEECSRLGLDFISISEKGSYRIEL